MKALTALAFGAGIVAAIGGGEALAQTKSTLDIVKERGRLRCQHGQPSPGFYEQTANGGWRGIDRFGHPIILPQWLL